MVSTPGKPPMHCRVEILQERDGLQILAPAVVVGNPLALLCASSRDRASRPPHPRAARRCDTSQPEQRVGDQEVADFVAAVIEDQRAPVGVLALSRVGVLVEMRAIEERQAMLRLCGKCAGTQSRITPMPCLVAVVDEVHEVFWRAIAARRRVIARSPDSPTTRSKGCSVMGISSTCV